MEIYMTDLTTEFPYELPKNMKFIKELDHGSFGHVILVRENVKNLDVAIKVINKAGAGLEAIERMKEEILILKKLNHKNIVKFYGYIETNTQLLIEMEYLKYGTLNKWMEENHKISEEDASVILERVLSAVEYLHNQRICHRDIKPENIMFSKENDFQSIKIIDFGLSANQFNYLFNQEYCGTFIYMAPEQIEKKLYYYSVDIWSIGILMFMLLNNGKHPFYQKGDSKEDFTEKIKNGKINFVNKVSYMAKNLIYKLCEPNPSWRYSADLAIKHPWITRNPNDAIPMTFNEILRRNNNKKNASSLMMINIFLNFAKKNILKSKNNNLSLKKKKNERIYKINYEYIKKCDLFSKKAMERKEKLKERYLEVLSTDEEDSFDKIKNDDDFIKNIDFKSKKCNSIIVTKHVSKSYFDEEQKSELINIKRMQITTDKKKTMVIKNYNNFFKNYNKHKKLKERKRSSCSRLFSLPDKNKSMDKSKNEIKQSSQNTNELKNISNLKKSIISNSRNKSSNKFNINKNCKIDDNKNIQSEKINKLEKTPDRKPFLIRKNKFKLKTNLPFVTKLDEKLSFTSNKKNICMRNYNIIPLVLPFIQAK